MTGKQLAQLATGLAMAAVLVGVLIATRVPQAMLQPVSAPTTLHPAAAAPLALMGRMTVVTTTGRKYVGTVGLSQSSVTVLDGLQATAIPVEKIKSMTR